MPYFLWLESDLKLERNSTPHCWRDGCMESKGRNSGKDCPLSPITSCQPVRKQGLCYINTKNGIQGTSWMNLEADISSAPPARNVTLLTPWFLALWDSKQKRELNYIAVEFLRNKTEIINECWLNLLNLW